MSERLLRMAERSNREDIYPEPVPVAIDPADAILPEAQLTARYLALYMERQTVRIDDDAHLVGLLRFHGCPVASNVFQRMGHTHFHEAARRFYLKTDDNLTCFEWQHANADFGKLLRLGIQGYLDEIIAARRRFPADPDRLLFLAALEKTCHAIVGWAERCARECVKRAELATDPDRRRELRHMANLCRRVPARPARTFEEAVQSVFICFHFLPDSLGLPDRYLRPLYEHDLAEGILTREGAKELLQELFVMVNGFTPPTSRNADKGGESHFVIGGYLPDHTDGFCDLSRLILEAMMELPLRRPQVSLRWTRKTPFAVLRYAMDCERHDPCKRIAFANDEPRIAAFMKFGNLAFEQACRYVVVGCNEPTFEGTIDLSGCKGNLIRALLDTFANRTTEVCEAPDFDTFYAIFDEELQRTLAAIVDRMNEFNTLRARDINVLSSLFIEGCVEQARSCTQGGSKSIFASSTLMGYVNLIDSLAVVQQFVFAERRITMRELLDALRDDWAGHGELRAAIRRDAQFFGNDGELANGIARRLSDSIAGFATGKTNLFGTPIIFGNLTGYNPHHAWFGALTSATPDGRHAGDMLTFGFTPAGGHARDGLTAVLEAVASGCPSGVMNGSSVFNLSLDRQLVANDANLEKTARLVETYFKLGGLHVQLNYVDEKELLDAKANPGDHQDLRVRVSGFSGHFVKLAPGLQDDIIARTAHR